MKYLLLTFFGGAVLCAGCDNSRELKLREKEAELKQRELALRQQEISQNNKQLSNTVIADSKSSYVYVILTVSQPEIIVQTIDKNEIAHKIWETRQRIPKPRLSGSSLPDIIEPEPSPEYVQQAITIPQNIYYKSNIIEVKDVSEDSKYQLMDNYQKQIQVKLAEDDQAYSFKIQRPRKSEIIKRDVRVFDSYAAASKSRNGE